MSFKNPLFLFIFPFYLLASLAIASPPSNPKNEPLRVLTSLAVLDFFVLEIAKDKAISTSVIPPSVEAESYEPSFSLMKQVSNARLFIGLGLPFEKAWLPRMLSSNKNLQQLPLHERLNEDSMHFWISLSMGEKIARLVTESISQIDPSNALFYEKNLEALLERLSLTKQKLDALVARMPKKAFIINHPMLDHFASEYGLEELALEQHGKKYGIADLLALAKKGKALGIKRIFSAHPDKNMQTLAREIGARVVVLSGFDSKYLENLEAFFDEISRSYED